MSATYQIWGSFSRGGDRSTPTTTSLFEKGQLMGDGVTTLEQFNRDFADQENDTFELMYEFTLPDTGAENDWGVLRAIDHAFWNGWFKNAEEHEDE